LIVLALDFLFLFFFISLSLHAVGCASGVDPPQTFKITPSNALLNPANRRLRPPTSAGRKDGGLFSFTFWFFMSISVTSFAQSSLPFPVYALLGFRSMVYATVCLIAVLVFGQSTRSVFFFANLPYTAHLPFFNHLQLLFLCRTILSSFVVPSLRIGRNRRY
jgi:hypothetical protein